MRVVIAVLWLQALGLSQAVNSQTTNEPGTDSTPRVGVVGTAHLDTQWRWTIRNTIDEFIPATFRDNFALMDIYPDYVFSFEGAFRYMLLREYYPDDYEKLRTYINDGRWRVCGSWVDAVDVNVPSFESLVRQVLYGNGYFEREFGVRSRDVYLPDCFGFGYALPSIAAHCGLKSFSSQKLSWGSAYGVPFDIGVWEGVDGSSLVAALKPGSYGTRIRDDLSRDTLWEAATRRQAGASGLAIAYMYFGTGDIGGSPDSLSVDWLARSIHSDGPLRVASVGADDLVDMVGEQNVSRLPRYKGELLMTRHGVGCYSSQAAMKRWNRKNELLADAAERASVVAHLIGGLPYPAEALRENWTRFLWHQFHDDLTGTSIPEAYEYSWNDEILCLNRSAGMLTAAVGAASAALDTRVRGVPLVVYNPLALNREDVVEAVVHFDKGTPSHVRVFGPDGNEVPSQVTELGGGDVRVLFPARVSSVGYAVYDVRPSEAAFAGTTGVTAAGRELENELYKVTTNDNGDVSSVFDKRTERELLSEPIVLELFKDKPRQWPAWEIQYEDLLEEPQVLADSGADIRVVESGPVRAAIEITRHWGQSVFVTRVSLAVGEAGDRVEFHNEVDWYEKETLLKAAFRFTTPSDSVTYDLGLGTIKRGINRPELYEVPGHQWAEMTSADGSYGVAVLNDCRYGWDHPDSATLRLTLIHTPGVFENWSWVGDQSSQDLGHHTFGYALEAVGPPGSASGTVWQAARFNQPLLAFQTNRHQGELGRNFSFLQVNPMDMTRSSILPCFNQIMVTAVKRAEETDEIIIRIRELCGERAGPVELVFPWSITAARELDGAEQPKGAANFEDKTLTTSLSPYQPRTFAVTLSTPSARVAKPSWQAVALPYNVDGVSLDSDRTDGDVDGAGNTLAGELIPDTIWNCAIGFVTGPTVAGEANLLACRGQPLTLPEGDFDHLYLLAAAVGGPAVGAFVMGDRSTEVSLQDYAEPIGRWNSRLIGDQFVEERDRIVPAYILRDPVGWVGTHRHTAADENESYQFTYLYLAELGIPEGTRELRLPDNDRMLVAAASVVRSKHDQVTPVQPLYDVADAAIAKVRAERTAFIDSMVVSLGSPYPGAEVHYTLDGTEPTASSAAYVDPFVLKETTVLQARALHEHVDDSYVTQAQFTRLIARAASVPARPTPGLMCRYYEGEWRRLPDCESLTPQKTAVVEAVGLPEFVRDEDYGLVMTGYVEVPTDGLWDFYIISDDGSALYVGDSLVADNDGIHGPEEVGGMIALKAGLHPIRVDMFQCKGGKYLEVSMQGPGFEKQPIAPHLLFREGIDGSH